MGESMKPIIVCGIDFSGTSMLAGLLHAAGVDMGDVESVEDVAASDRIVRYRTFECRTLRAMLAPLSAEMLENPGYISADWLSRLRDTFMEYCRIKSMYQEGSPLERPRWGVKCNGLLFLAMCDDFNMDAFDWLTTYRPLEDSLDSCFDKLGRNTRHAAMLAAEYVAWRHLVEKQSPGEFAFEDLLYKPQDEAWRLSRKLGLENRIDALSLINPYTKGVIPCHSSLPEPHYSAQP